MFINDAIIAIPTPYQNGAVDLQSLGNIVNHVYDKGYARVLVLGSTGDQHMLSLEEKKQVIEYMTSAFSNRQLMFGVSGNTTEHAKHLAHFIQQKDEKLPIMLSIPPYILPNDHEITEYVDTVLEDFRGDVLFYNNERRTGVDVSAYLINCLMKKWPSIKAVKEVGSNAHIDFVTPYIYTGFDAKMIEPHFYNVTTVMGNILPETALYFMNREKNEKHREIQMRYQAVIEELMPIGLVKVMKYLYKKQGIIRSDEARRPMRELMASERKQVDRLLEHIRVLEESVKG